MGMCYGICIGPLPSGLWYSKGGGIGQVDGHRLQKNETHFRPPTCARITEETFCAEIILPTYATFGLGADDGFFVEVKEYANVPPIAMADPMTVFRSMDS